MLGKTIINSFLLEKLTFGNLRSSDEGGCLGFGSSVFLKRRSFDIHYSDSQEHIEQDVITCNYKHQLSMQLPINSSLHSLQIYGSIRPRVSASIVQAFFLFAENPYLNLNTKNSRFQIFRIAIQRISVGQIVDCDSQEHSKQDVITCNFKHQLSICNSPLIALFNTHKYMDRLGLNSMHLYF